ncbi:hypothetical protein SLEP1_g59399 [Rubroshorea leprosula]|uniref:WRC domain-containing protein n=3 Tax=Rubroshorea leprosula TaxID=152421 RepID=A0AAV5MTC1_9ROSI|nr:hypothetical protein SLEP1_g42903 [Rubroshorea leprosula]GKV52839.1 hypothetical protein SLEP1_g59399 [Rubroshorea leprosula]
MRIRKRQLPFPLSSFLSSDPHFNRSPVVQLNNPHGNLTPHPSDRPNHHPIGVQTAVSDSSDKKMERDCLELKQERPTTAAAAAAAVQGQEGEERGEVERKSNDTRKKSILGADVGSGSGSSSRQAGERWYEEEKVFPLKKRRGRFVEDDVIMEKDKKANAKMKAKMNKKCVQQQNDNDPEEIKEVDGGNTTTTGARKRSRGGALMEGSRCSRVNGRGWRCCQQTLVGYSLCEHHLGKGRLRSMNSVRSRSLASTGTTAPEKDNLDHEPLSSSSSLQDKNVVVIDGDGDQTGNTDMDDKKPLMTTTMKKKMKLGMVKARSISSLLGQTNNALACAVDEDK